MRPHRFTQVAGGNSTASRASTQAHKQLKPSRSLSNTKIGERSPETGHVTARQDPIGSGTMGKGRCLGLYVSNSLTGGGTTTQVTWGHIWKVIGLFEWGVAGSARSLPPLHLKQASWQELKLTLDLTCSGSPSLVGKHIATVNQVTSSRIRRGKKTEIE